MQLVRRPLCCEHWMHPGLFLTLYLILILFTVLTKRCSDGTRISIRRRYGIGGNCCRDSLIWIWIRIRISYTCVCVPCDLTQQMRTCLYIFVRMRGLAQIHTSQTNNHIALFRVTSRCAHHSPRCMYSHHFYLSNLCCTQTWIPHSTLCITES
jgi:hypothetical protein